MLIGDKNYQSIWVDEDDPSAVCVIDQQKLPFYFEIRKIRSVDDMYGAIHDMTVRGAPVIGAAGAFGVYLATLGCRSTSDPLNDICNCATYLASCRPTAVNLSGAINYMVEKLRHALEEKPLSETALEAAREICSTEIESCRRIGRNGLPLIEAVSRKKKGAAVNILTHCNAGWLACIDYGTALSPVYFAHEAGIPVHVWVDETRPGNQGARLTTWELEKAGVPYTLIPDNMGGHLMQHGMIDLVFVGCDRASRKGDVANKIGTYLKALAAFDNNVPFYSALPSSSFDFNISDAVNEIPVEERDAEEVTGISGLSEGKIISVRICPENAHALNYSFDVTPARLITGLITERGICRPGEKDIKKMFSDKFR